jgi:hypothetical protein
MSRYFFSGEDGRCGADGDGVKTASARSRIDQIPEKKAAIVGVNIRTLRQRKG